MRDDVRPDIRHGNQKIPSSRHDRSWQIGRGRVGFADRKARFVAAAGPAKSVRIEDSEIEPSPLVFARVMKCNCQAKNLGRYMKRNLNVGLVLCVCNHALQYQVGSGFRFCASAT